MPQGMQSRMAPQPRLQEFKQALWKTFLLHEPPKRGIDHLAEFRRGEALEPLEAQARVPRRHPFIGVALWNLLPYMEDGGPKGFTELLRDVLALELDQAVRLRRDRVDVLPPFPDPLIGDSRWLDFTSDETGWHLTFEMCVVKRFENFSRRFERWFGAPFWERTDGRIRGRNPAPLTYHVHLPDDDGRGSAATFTVTGLVSNDLERSLAFDVTGDRRFTTFRGTVRITKEEGHPGATRVQQSRTIKFGNDVRDRHRPTLTYWLQADALCLALN